MRLIRRRSCTTLALTLLTAYAAAGWPQNCTAQGWVDWRISGPFICRAEFPLTGLKGLLGELAQLQDDLVRDLRVPPVQEPIELYLFRDKQSYSRYLKQYLPEIPYRRALYVKSQGPGMVLAYQSRALEIDVRHECTHALLHAVLPVVPLWLDEGLAEYFEVPSQERVFDNPHLVGLRWDLRLGRFPRLDILEKKASLSEMGRAEYRSSWAWVHFMLHGPREAHDELVGFLQDIRLSGAPGLLSQRLRRRVPETQRRLIAHFRSWKR